MKKAVVLISVLAILIALSGCPQPPAPGNGTIPSSEYKDCGTEMDCVMASAKNCEKAFATATESDSSSPFEMTVKIQVNGFQGSACSLDYKIEKITNAGGADEEAFVSMLAAMLQGKQMACLIPQDILPQIDTLSMDDVQGYCSGDLVDILQQV